MRPTQPMPPKTNYISPRKVMLLERSSVIPKHIWQDTSCLRTLTPIEVTQLIKGAWKSNRSEAVEQGSIVMSLKLDGSGNGDEFSSPRLLFRSCRRRSIPLKHSGPRAVPSDSSASGPRFEV